MMGEKRSPEEISGRIPVQETVSPGNGTEENSGGGFWDNPENILRLIDLIFLCEEDSERLPRS